MAHSSAPNPLDDLRSYAGVLVDSARDLDPATLHLTPGSPVPERPHRFTVPAMAAMSLVAILLFAEVGIAVIANSAVPGDQFYGIDLFVEDALTAIGVPIDSASERIDEAEELLARDEISEAIRTARSGYREMDPPVINATIGPLIRAETVLARGVDQAVEEAVRRTLADLLATTRHGGALEVGDAPAIRTAALEVARAAEGTGGATP